MLLPPGIASYYISRARRNAGKLATSSPDGLARETKILDKDVRRSRSTVQERTMTSSDLGIWVNTSVDMDTQPSEKKPRKKPASLPCDDSTTTE